MTTVLFQQKIRSRTWLFKSGKSPVIDSRMWHRFLHKYKAQQPTCSVKNHKVLKTGHYTRFWCSQDEARKKKPKKSQDPNMKQRDNRHGGPPTLNIHFEHHQPHVHYYDVRMPEGAAAIIHQNADTLTPVQIAQKVRHVYPSVTSQQVSSAWSELSKMFWKRSDDQITSLKTLLAEYKDDIDVFDVGRLPDGVEMVCWGLKKINDELKGKVVEIGI
ncbi:hypothetical protein GGU11DRAFT_694249, partial [Lentinula aff. detonsa]